MRPIVPHDIIGLLRDKRACEFIRRLDETQPAQAGWGQHNLLQQVWRLPGADFNLRCLPSSKGISPANPGVSYFQRKRWRL
jgi:hypothetical protein